MPGWKKIQEQVKERDKERDEQRRQAQTLPADHPKRPAQYKHTKGEEARVAEKDFYHKLATSGYMDKILADMDTLISDPAKDFPEETKATVRDLRTKLAGMWQSWKDYTEAYTQINADNRSGVTEQRSAETFLKRLKECVDVFEGDDFALMKKKIADEPAMLSCYTTLKHLEGHYEEMTNGTLVTDGETDIDDFHKKEMEDPNSDSIQKNIEKTCKAKGYDHGEVVFEKYTGPLFPHEVTPNDIQQGHLGDCYFLAALSSLAANNGHLIRKMMKDEGDTVLVEVNQLHKYRDGGVDHDYSSKRYIRVSKKLPVVVYYKKDENGKLQQAFKQDPYAKNCPWVQFLEKAYSMSAAMNTVSSVGESGEGRYFEVAGGTTARAMNSLLGKDVANNEFISRDSENWNEIFDKIRKAEKQGKVMTCSTRQSRKKYYADDIRELTHKLLENDQKYAQIVDGNERDAYVETVRSKAEREFFRGLLIGNHAYSLIGTMKHKTLGDCVIVRNPHSSYDHDGEKMLKSGVFDPDTQEIPNGYSVIPKEDFRDWFNSVTITDVPDPKAHIDHGKDIRGVAVEIFKGLDKSRTGWLRLGMKGASQDFKDFYNAAKDLRDLVKSPICSEKTLTDAMERVNAAAQKYSANRENHTKDFEARNLRCCLAKATVSMCEAFQKRDSEAIKPKLHKLATQLVRDRLDYCYQPDPAGPRQGRITASMEYTMGRMTTSELMKMAAETKGSNMSSVMLTKMQQLQKQIDTDNKLRAADDAKRNAELKR